MLTVLFGNCCISASSEFDIRALARLLNAPVSMFSLLKNQCTLLLAWNSRSRVGIAHQRPRITRLGPARMRRTEGGKVIISWSPGQTGAIHFRMYLRFVPIGRTAGRFRDGKTSGTGCAGPATAALPIASLPIGAMPRANNLRAREYPLQRGEVAGIDRAIRISIKHARAQR